MRNKNQLKISFKAQLGRGVILQLEFNPLKIEWKRDHAYIIPEVPSPYKLELFIRDKFTYSQIASGIITYKVNLETKDILTALKGQEYKVEAFVADLMEKNILVIKSVLMKYYKTLGQEKLAGKIKNLTEYSHFQASDSLEIKKGIFVSKFIFIYDPNGNLTEENRYAADNSMEHKDIFKYNSKEKLIELKRFNSDNSELYKVTYKYDNADKLIEENNVEDIDYLNLDDEGYIRKFRYDEMGNKAEQFQYNAFEQLESKYQYKYDGKSNLIEMNSFLIDRDKNIATEVDFKYLYEYDNDNNLIAESRYHWNNLFHITNFKYNDKGMCMARNYHDFSNVTDVKITMTKIEYKNFDKEGNWLMRIEYENDKPRWIHEREIMYF